MSCCGICVGHSGTGAPSSVSSFYQCSVSGVRQDLPVDDGVDVVLICTKTVSSQSGYELDDTDVTPCEEVLVFLFLTYCSKSTFCGHYFFTDKGGHSITNSTRIPLLILARFHSFIFPLLLSCLPLLRLISFSSCFHFCFGFIHSYNSFLCLIFPLPYLCPLSLLFVSAFTLVSPILHSYSLIFVNFFTLMRLFLFFSSLTSL
jgi:hypothetical protein